MAGNRGACVAIAKTEEIFDAVERPGHAFLGIVEGPGDSFLTAPQKLLGAIDHSEECFFHGFDFLKHPVHDRRERFAQGVAERVPLILEKSEISGNNAHQHAADNPGERVETVADSLNSVFAQAEPCEEIADDGFAALKEGEEVIDCQRSDGHRRANGQNWPGRRDPCLRHPPLDQERQAAAAGCESHTANQGLASINAFQPGIRFPVAAQKAAKALNEAAEQILAGVVDLRPEVSAEVRELLTFAALPRRDEIHARAEDIAEIAAHYDLANTDYGIGEEFASHAMIGGALWLMAPLEEYLRQRGITPLYAFSERVTEEATQPDGSVRKTNVFRHVGFVE